MFVDNRLLVYFTFERVFTFLIILKSSFGLIRIHISNLYMNDSWQTSNPAFNGLYTRFTGHALDPHSHTTQVSAQRHSSSGRWKTFLKNTREFRERCAKHTNVIYWIHTQLSEPQSLVPFNFKGILASFFYYIFSMFKSKFYLIPYIKKQSRLNLAT